MKRTHWMIYRNWVLFLALAFVVVSCTAVPTMNSKNIYIPSSSKHLDRHIDAVLKREGLTPSKQTSDAAFL